MLSKRIPYIALAACLPLLPVAASSQESNTAYNFLNITSSSKIYGLGGMNISLVDDDLMSTDQNPALLGSEMSNQIAVNYMRYIGGSNFMGARYARAIGERAAWSAGIQYLSYGSMPETSVDGTVTGEFSVSDYTFSGSFAHDITECLRGGIDIKFVGSSYAEYSAFAIAADLGINYYDPEHDLSLSVVAANLGGQVKRFNDTYDRLPVDVRVGWSQSFGTFPVRFSVTAWNLTKWHLPYVDNGDGTDMTEAVIKDGFMSNLMRHLVFGADLISSDTYYIGLGYNYKMRTDMSTYSRSFISGWSLAAGMTLKNFGFGLALAQPHTGATTFMFNVSCSLTDLLQ